MITFDKNNTAKSRLQLSRFNKVAYLSQAKERHYVISC